MRNMPEVMWDTWEAGQFVGTNKPVTRAVIQKSVLRAMGPWRTLMFAQDEPNYEIPGIKSVSINTAHQSDSASMTLTMMNQIEVDVTQNLDLTHAGQTPSAIEGPSVKTLKDLAFPGYYSFRRGETPSSLGRWGHEPDPVWADMFIPNRLIRTFQGYGTDGAVNPWDDTNLILTGTWLIDNVTFDTKGLITIQCRDTAKLLIEQRLYPPIIPLAQYPLEICADEIETTEVTTQETTGQEEVIGENVAKHMPSSLGWDSSSAPWYGYNAPVYGHRASHAFDGDGSTYWLSVGNSGPNKVWSFEWIGAVCNGEPIRRVRMKPKFGGYVCYVAVKENGKWQGTNRVPYGKTSTPAYPNGSDKLYVKKVNVPRNEEWFNIDLDRSYNADEVWLIFTNLADSNLGTYQFRAGVKEFEVMGYTPDKTTTVDVTTEVETLIPGNIEDYTDIIKVLAAWSGFYWPYGPADEILTEWEADLKLKDADAYADLPGGLTDGKGRAWGDFAYSGAFPVDPVCIPPSFWDNKSVMDGINQIKEILGFIFYVDATGGIVWRMPNIWSTGNFISGVGFVGPDSVRTIDETQVLVDYGVTVNDEALRSEIHVVAQPLDSEGAILHTSISPGFVQGEVIPSAVNPAGDLALLGGQQRVMLVANYPFVSQDEVDKFAYLISLWIHWSYRKGKFRIPGNPAYEPDDQVRIFERVTSESYIHYLQGINSVMDLDAGTWFLDVNTHWLGIGPDATWVVNTFNDMPPALYAYLIAIGAIDEDGERDSLPDDWDPRYVYPELPEDYERILDDYAHLFPGLPSIDFPYDDSWSDEDIANDIGHDHSTPPVDGSGGGSVNSRSERWRYSYWGARGSDRVRIVFRFAGNPAAQAATIYTTVPRASVLAFRKLGQALGAEDYNVTYSTAFAGTGRKIAGTNIYSAHAWGLAIDINPGENPCCKLGWASWIARTNSVDFYAAVRKIMRIRTAQTNSRVFGWGGYWRTKKDYMHFEVISTRTQLLEGVVQT